MLPDIRFAIGAVLAGALLIVTAFGLAATVRVAHHRTVSPFESSRVLAYADPIDWSARPDAFRRLADPRGNDSLLERLAAIPSDPIVIGSTQQSAEREPVVDAAPSEVAPPADAIATLLAVPVEPQAPPSPPQAVASQAAAPQAAVQQAAPAPDEPAEAPVVTPPVVVAMAEIPATEMPVAKVAETEQVPAERFAALPTPDEAVSKVEADPPPATTPPLPTKKPVVKAAKKKAVKRKTARTRTVVRPPTASTGYPVTSGNRGFAGFEKNFFVD
jgi:hypothetical protein